MSDSTEEGVSDVLYRIQLVYDQKMKIQTASDPSGMPRIKCPTCTMTVCNTDCKARSMVLAMNTDFKWLQSDLQAYTQGKDTKISQEKKELGLRAFQNKYKELLADSADMVTVFKQDGTFAAMEMKKNDLFAIMNEFIDNCSQFEIAGERAVCKLIRFTWATLRQDELLLLNNAFQSSDPERYPEDDEDLALVFDAFSIVDGIAMLADSKVDVVEDPPSAEKELKSHYASGEEFCEQEEVAELADSPIPECPSDEGEEGEE